jgi:nucleoside-diphosphate-sugar epimerase
MKTALVCGAGGFIGGHLVRRLKRDGLWVRAVDRNHHEFAPSEADEFILGDLRDGRFCKDAIDRPFDEVYQLAAEMGGAEFVYARRFDADILQHCMMIDLNVVTNCIAQAAKRVFFASSACVYPQGNQTDRKTVNCAEDSVYPADPDSEYGWTKLFGEHLYLTHGRCSGLQARIARYHNVFGPCGPWSGGREKAPAALCRKVALARNGDSIEIFGDGQQTRTFLLMHRGNVATDAFGRQRATQYRLRRDGDHRRACRPRYQDLRQDPAQDLCPGTDRSSRPQLGQPAHPRGTRVGAFGAAAHGPGTDLCVG